MIDGVDREDEAPMRQEEVDVVFVNHSPNIVQPAGNALDRLFQELVAMGALSDECSLGVTVDFVEEAVHLPFLRAEVEHRDGCMSAVHLGCARKDLSSP